PSPDPTSATLRTHHDMRFRDLALRCPAWRFDAWGTGWAALRPSDLPTSMSKAIRPTRDGLVAAWCTAWRFDA
ncbi:hypothetical protein, partial [Spongiactinospora gelatinilytica]|uniref:hypothetical protein n=1 Tax=Spongiactinospora gelatinilytica TaxID=2666298 RepID=UPI001F3D8362